MNKYGSGYDDKCAAEDALQRMSLLFMLVMRKTLHGYLQIPPATTEKVKAFDFFLRRFCGFQIFPQRPCPQENAQGDEGDRVQAQPDQGGDGSLRARKYYDA